MEPRDSFFSILAVSTATGILCLTLLTGLGAVYGSEPKKPKTTPVQKNVARARLRDVPALRKLISVEFNNPKAQDIVVLVQKLTGQRLSLDASVIQDRPISGQIILNEVPAWDALESLAENRYVEGYWTKRGDEYVLIATYAGKPPPLPPEIPPHLRAAMERATKGLPPDSPPQKAPSPDVPAKLGMGYLLAALPIVLVLGIAFLVHRWRRTPQAQTESKKPQRS